MTDSEEEHGIDYSQGLTTLLKGHHEGQLHLKMNALRLLSNILERFNDRLVSAFAAINGKEVRSQPTVQVDAMFKAVQEMITGKDVQTFALAEGQRHLALYRTGILVYVAGYVKPKKKILRTSPLAYLPSVSAVYMHLFPENHVTSGVEKTVAQWIGQLSREIANRCKESCDEGDVTPSHIKQAVDILMPPNLAAHANAEGFRFMVMFEQGHLTMKFRPDFVKRKKSLDHSKAKKSASSASSLSGNS